MPYPLTAIRNVFTIMRFMYLTVALNVLAGCVSPFPTRTIYPDAKTDQPWAGHALRAEGMVIVETGNVTGVRWLEWATPNGKTEDSRKVTKKCEAFLRKQNMWNSLGFHLANEGTSDEHITHIYKKLVIVCIDPVIVAIGPGKTNYYQHPMSAYPDTLSTFRERSDGIETTGSGLTRGFVYGTYVPYTPDVIWFSPDLKIGPTAAKKVSEDKQRVQVPWGNLVFTHIENEWIVTTEGDLKGVEE